LSPENPKPNVLNGANDRSWKATWVSPFGSKRVRAVKKEQKHYHLDWSVVPGEAQRFENLVGAHLLK